MSNLAEETSDMSEYTNQSCLPESFINAVIEQFGDWEYFIQNAENMPADAGWPGFSYHSDTVPFAQKHRLTIANLLRQDAEEHGVSTWLELVAGFNCLEGYTAADIEQGFYGDEADENHTPIYNALAWYALERVAQDATIWLESL